MKIPKNIEDLIKLKIDFIGFIFYPKSKRYLKNELSIEIPKSIKRVGVFVNELKVMIEKIDDGSF